MHIMTAIVGPHTVTVLEGNKLNKHGMTAIIGPHTLAILECNNVITS